MDEEINYDDEPHLMSLEDAENTFRHLRYWHHKLEQTKEHTKKEIEKAKRFEESQTAKINKKIAWHELGLQAYLKSTHQKSVDLINGKATLCKSRTKAEVKDEAAFNEWLTQHDASFRERFISVKQITAPNIFEIKANYKETGEIPSGVDIWNPPDKLRVTLNEMEVEPEKDINFI